MANIDTDIDLLIKAPANNPALLNPPKLSPPTCEVLSPKISPPSKFCA